MVAEFGIITCARTDDEPPIGFDYIIEACARCAHPIYVQPATLIKAQLRTDFTGKWRLVCLECREELRLLRETRT